MLQPIVKENGITKRERYLAKLADETFFGLWSYPNVYTNEGISKNLIGKELCDLLVVFGETLLIFSDKDIKFNENKPIDVAWKRWFKKSVIKSCAQLYGAESWIRRKDSKLFLDKECDSDFPIDLSSISNIHLIAVTCNSNKPAQKYLGGDNPSLFQNFRLNSKECSDNNFTIGDLYPNKTFVHVLDEFTLDLLIKELSTIADFINYLSEKVKAIRGNKVIAAAGEEELLSLYFQGRNENNYLGEITCSTDEPMLLDHGLWTEFKSSQEYSVLNESCRSSKLWDELIQRFSESIITANVGKFSEYPIEHHERALRHMASEPRVSRYFLSKAFEDKFNEVPIDRRSSRLVISPTEPSKMIIFLFFPRSNKVSDSEYRELRFQLSRSYALVGKYLYPAKITFLVLSTETKGTSRRSEDIFSIEYGSKLSKDELFLAKKLYSDEKILNTTWTSRKCILDVESITQPKINLSKKYGRNDRCHCGSNKKYKKCCWS
jgi:hypothetical protein